MKIHVTMEENCQRVIVSMRSENKLRNLHRALNHDNPDVQAFHFLLATMYFVLHAETRIALKFLMIFIEGYCNCIEGTLYANTGVQGPARVDQHVKDIEKVVNEQILGSELNCAQ